MVKETYKILDILPLRDKLYCCYVLYFIPVKLKVFLFWNQENEILKGS